MRSRGIVCAALGLIALVAIAHRSEPASSAPRPPNVVMIMTDDQNASDMHVMPQTRRLIGGSGVTFANSFVSYPLCCPSRATFLTGRYAHNHNVLSQNPPRGGYGRLNGRHTLAVWLKAAGYRTIHIGKYLNGYGVKRSRAVPPGWTEWRGSVDPTTYRYWGYTLNEDGHLVTYGRPRVENPRTYQTDVYTRIAERAIRRDADRGPFFLNVAFLAPHTEAGGYGSPGPRPAPRDVGRFSNARLPHPPSFNEADVSDKPPFLRRQKIGPHQQNAIVRRYRDRLETLLDVDRSVAAIIDTLRRTGQLSHTYVFFTSDNGLFHGEHRIKANKFFAYDPATRVPLLLRGPGIPHGVVSRELVANVDLAPTIVAASGATPSRRMDGRSLLRFAEHPGVVTRRPLLHEAPVPLRDSTSTPVKAPSYSAIRRDRWLYVEWSNGSRELYDLKRDPGELRSLAGDRRYGRVRRMLGGQLHRLRHCAGGSCRMGRPTVPAP